MKLEIPRFLKNIAFEAACPIYIVGGYIRNSLLGLKKSDIDICGALLPEHLGISAKIVPVNKRLGTAIITDGIESYEYTPFRKESYGTGGEHKPVEVSFDATITEDARRRDFTAGSVYYDIRNDEFIDPYGGLNDIDGKILRSFDPDYTLCDDGLRLMRLVRIAAETGFSIEKNTFDAAVRYADKLADISPERKRVELDKILTADLKYGIADAHYRGVELLKELGLWRYIIKEVADMDGVEQNPLYHKYDVLEHSLMAVKYAPPDIRLAALLHDVGKPPCLIKDGNFHFHAVVGGEMVKQILGSDGLKYPNAVIDRVYDLVRLHMYDMDGRTGIGKLKIFLCEHFDIVPQLIELIEADGKATGVREVVQPHRFKVVYDELIASKAPIKISDLKIGGAEVVAAGYKGKEISEVLNKLWRECVLNPHLNDRDKLIQKITGKKRYVRSI